MMVFGPIDNWRVTSGLTVLESLEFQSHKVAPRWTVKMLVAGI